MYDKNSNQFQAVEKSKLLERILDSRSNDVESFYEVDQAKLKDRDRHALEQLLEDINKDDKQTKTEKYKAIKIIAHNNLSKILDKYKKRKLKKIIYLYKQMSADRKLEVKLIKCLKSIVKTEYFQNYFKPQIPYDKSQVFFHLVEQDAKIPRPYKKLFRKINSMRKL